MVFEVGVMETFEAAHSLKGDFGIASRVHGHTYRVEAALEGERLSPEGVLYDIAKLREALREIIGELHMRNLDELEEFSNVNSTAENLCILIHKRLLSRLSLEGISALKVTVWENQFSYASYKATLRPSRDSNAERI